MKMNKKLFVLSATFALASQFGTTAMAANADGDASVTVIEPLTITSVTDLDFGTIAAGPIAGTVQMVSGGALSVPSGGPELQVLEPVGTPGTFTIAGESDAETIVDIPATVILSGGGGDDMNVTLGSNGGAPGGAAVTLSAAGGFDLEIFGILDVGPDQGAGDYLGTYNVTVFYQ